MKIRLNHAISAGVLVVFVITLANANSVPQDSAVNNQSSPVKPSANISSNKIHILVPHIEAPEKSTTVNTSNPALVKPTANTTTVMSTYINTDATTTIKVSGPANNTSATTSVKGMAGTRTVIIANVGTANENRTDVEENLNIKNIIRPAELQNPDGRKSQCPARYIETPNGDCKPRFVEN
ncbi:hypothetical protein QTP88_026884 [Uroleucon formosanum]